MLYLVAYDIADPRRRQRVARLLERRALRWQKSVFLFDGDAAAVAALLDDAARLMRADADVIQAWRLAGGESPRGLVRGTPLNACPAGVILGAGPTLFIGDDNRP